MIIDSLEILRRIRQSHRHHYRAPIRLIKVCLGLWTCYSGLIELVHKYLKPGLFTNVIVINHNLSLFLPRNCIIARVSWEISVLNEGSLVPAFIAFHCVKFLYFFYCSNCISNFCSFLPSYLLRCLWYILIAL